MPINSNKPITKFTQGNQSDIEDLVNHVWEKEEIKNFRLDEAIESHPLANKPTNTRSKLAYKYLLSKLKPTSKYLLPGQFVVFSYNEPKTKEDLEYYDATPATLFFGITRTASGNIREVGFNMHYFPPYARMKIMNLVYEVYKQYYNKFFNEPGHKPNRFISYKQLKAMLRRSGLGFGIRMYVPSLRGRSYVIPTRLLSTTFFTEGHFNGATLTQIRRYWRSNKLK